MLCDLRSIHRYGSRYENRLRVVWYAACSCRYGGRYENRGKGMVCIHTCTPTTSGWWVVQKLNVHCIVLVKYALNFISGVVVFYDVGLQEASCIMQRSKVSKSLLLCYCSKA